MKIYKQALSLLIVGTLTLSPLSVFADDNTDTTEDTTEATDLQSAIDEFNETVNTTMTLSDFTDMVNTNSSSFEKLNNDDVFQMMKNSLDEGESIKLTEAFEISEGLEIPSNFMYDLSECGMDGTVDASSINLEYASLLAQMDSNYETAMSDLSSYSVSATELFNNTYGDLATELQISEVSLPEDFNFASISETNLETMNSVYQDMMNQSDFSNVMNTVSISDVFEQASNGPTSYSLKTDAQLDSLLSKYSADLEVDYEQTKDQTESSMLSKQSDTKNSITSNGDQYKNIVDEKQTENDEKRAAAEEKESEIAEDTYYSPGNTLDLISDEMSDDSNFWEDVWEYGVKRNISTETVKTGVDSGGEVLKKQKQSN